MSRMSNPTLDALAGKRLVSTMPRMEDDARRELTDDEKYERLERELADEDTMNWDQRRQPPPEWGR